MEKELIKSPDMTQQKPLYNNVRYYITRVRAHVCVCARRPVNFCTNCTNPPFSFALPGLTFAPLKSTFTPLKLTFTMSRRSLRVPPVHPLSGSPGRACKSVNGEKAPGRTDRHANRDKDQSNVSTYGKQPPDKDRGNRVGQVLYAHRYGFQKSSYLIFMCYISSKIDINHDIIKDMYVNNRLKQTLIDSNSPKVTNAYTHSITFALLSSTS